MLKSICYKSTLKRELSILETEHLFDICKKNNDNLNLKGLLYKCETCFFQIIEGPEKNIDALFTKIKEDKRHKNIKVLMNQPIKEFTFKSFNTGYYNVEELDSIFGLQEYLHHMEVSNLPEKKDFLEIISNLFNVKL